MWNNLIQSFTLITALSAILDIAVVTTLFYCLFMAIQRTRAVQLIKGLAILILAVVLSNWLHLQALGWLLNQLWTVSIVALAVIFQPELRRALEQIGRSRIYINPFENTDTDLKQVHEAVVKAAVEESKHNVGMLLVLAGALLDRVDWKRFKRSYLWGLLAIGSASIAVLGKISEERDIFSLGSRLPIWKGALEVIKKYPEGWGMRCGDSLFYAGDTGWMVNNAHNVFLNAVLRFSIPVGICFTVLLVTVMIYTIIKARSLLVAGMWAGVFLLMNIMI